MDYAQVRDEELVARIVEQDERALERLYDKYGRSAYSLVLKMLHDPARSEEVIQEVFLKLWRRPESYTPGRASVATWLLSIAHHRAVDELRSIRREQLVSDDNFDGAFEPIDGDDDPADAAWLREERQTVRAAMASLPAAQRSVVELAYFHGLTQREIAERTGEPLGTIKTRVRLAIQKLRAHLESNGAMDWIGPRFSPPALAEVRRADV